MRDYLDWRTWAGIVFRRGYFSELDRRLKTVFPERGSEIRRQVQTQFGSIYNENKGHVVNQASKFSLMIGSLLLATYRVLLPVIEDRESVMDIIGSAAGQSARRWTRLRMFVGMGISPLSPHKAFDRISRNIKKSGERVFGSYFVYEEELGDQQFSLNIRRCFFYDFFSAQGAPELTGVCCSLDNWWADELKNEKYGVRFERPTTIARGGDMCRFQFTKTKAEAEAEEHKSEHPER